MVFMIASAAAQANQCPGGGECPSDDMPKVVVSLLQAKLQMNAREVSPERQELDMLQGASTGTSIGMLSTWQDAFKDDPALFDGCSKVFVDVGANRGTHVRKLFEPAKYPTCPYLAVFDQSFGTSRSKPFSETGICAFGFEANPRWTSTLKQVEKAYTAQGWRTKFFAPTAVSNESGSITFWLNDVKGEHSDWGASMEKLTPLAKAVQVPAIDLSGFMQELSAHSLPGYKLMKMDIEGAEFIVLPKLLERNLLCESNLDKLTIEWHERVLNADEVPGANRTRQRAMSLAKCGGQPATMVVDLDDESYLDDGMALP